MPESKRRIMKFRGIEVIKPKIRKKKLLSRFTLVAVRKEVLSLRRLTYRSGNKFKIV